ncbi:MAG TPA: MFS transporter [Solirubrobacteraceae bacterium]|nr:MFS transporter [Solirubrobacteraceae bacterium]
MPLSALAVAGVVLLAFNMRTAIAEIPPVLPDLGLSAAGQSVLAAVPVICFGLAALGAPAVRTWVGEERGLLAALLVLLGGLLVRAAWPEQDVALFGGTVLVGCSIAVMNVLVPSLVRRRFSGHVGLMTGVYTTALVAGGSIAAATTVPLRDAAGGSLHVALGIWAIPLVLGIVAWLPQRGHGALPPGAGGREAIRALGRSPVAWYVTAFMGFQSLLYYAPLSWLPAIHRDQGIDPATAGVLLSTMNLVSIPTTFLAPVLAHRMRDQRKGIAACVALTVIGLAGILLAPPSTALVWVLIMGLGQGAALSLALLMIVLRAGDDHTAARLSSMAQGFGYLLAAAGPLLMGLLHALSGDWTVPLLALIALCAAELWAGLAAGRARVVQSG